MTIARCKWYDDAGLPIKHGCRRQGQGCDFVHPSESLWDTAPRYVPPANSGGTSRNDTSNGWNAPPRIDSRFKSSAGSAASHSNAMPKVVRNVGYSLSSFGKAPKKAPEPREDGGEASGTIGWGAPVDGWGAADGGGDSGTTGWGAPVDGWGSTTSGWVSPKPGDWGAPDSGWGAQDSTSEKTKTWGEAIAAESGGSKTTNRNTGSSTAAASGWADADNARCLATAPAQEASSRAAQTQRIPSGSKDSGNLDSGGARKDVGVGRGQQDPSNRNKGEERRRREEETKEKAQEKTASSLNDPDVSSSSIDHIGYTPEHFPGHRTDRDEGKGKARALPLLSKQPPDRPRALRGFDIGSGDSRGRSESTPASEMDTQVSPFAALFTNGDTGSTRRTSPSPSATDSSSDSPNTWGHFLKTVARALHYSQELASSREQRDRVRRLQKSRQFGSAGEKAIQRLTNTRNDIEKRCHSMSKRLEQVIAELANYPLTIPGVSLADVQSNVRAETEDLNAYTSQVQGWINSIQPFIQQLQEQAKAVPSAGSKRKRILGDDEDMQPPATRMANLEEKLDELENCMQGLRSNYKSMLRQQIETKIPQDATNSASDSAGSTAEQPLASQEEGEVTPTPPPGDPNSHIGMLGRRLKAVNAQLQTTNDELVELKKRDVNGWREYHNLRAESKTLRLQFAEMQQNSDKLVEKQQELDSQIARIQETLAKLTPAASTLAPPLVLDDVVARVCAEMLPPVRVDVKDALSALRQGVQEVMVSQQENLYGKVWNTLQPTVSVVDTYRKFMDAHTRGTGPLTDVQPRNVNA